jgi:ParB-like chromosome segregation protein Spo0J
MIDLQTHPAADLFPLMDGQEFDELVQDIKANGLIEPVWLTRDRLLLDGRNRYRACAEAGAELQYRIYEGSDPIGFAVSLNLKRRHLTEGQKAMLGLKVEEHYSSQSTVGRPKKEEAEIVADRPQLSTEDRKSRSKAAKAVGSKSRNITKAKRIKKHAPDLAEKVESGELALDKAEKQVSRRIKDAEEQEAREIVMAEVPSDASGENWRLYHGAFQDRLAELPDGSVDLIVTDPPYPAEFMHLWPILSEHAARVLKPQGILVALTGAIMLPEVIASLGQRLSWGWMYIQPLPGANSRIMARHVLQSYKPWLAFSKGPWPSGGVDWHPDTLDASSRAKDRYRWEQDPDPAKMLVDALSPKGGTVLDPYTGTGSYGIAALSLGRKFIGVEHDAQRFSGAVERLKAHG